MISQTPSRPVLPGTDLDILGVSFLEAGKALINTKSFTRDVDPRLPAKRIEGKPFNGVATDFCAPPTLPKREFLPSNRLKDRLYRCADSLLRTSRSGKKGHSEGPLRMLQSLISREASGFCWGHRVGYSIARLACAHFRSVRTLNRSLDRLRQFPELVTVHAIERDTIAWDGQLSRTRHLEYSIGPKLREIVEQELLRSAGVKTQPLTAEPIPVAPSLKNTEQVRGVNMSPPVNMSHDHLALRNSTISQSHPDLEFSSSPELHSSALGFEASLGLGETLGSASELNLNENFSSAFSSEHQSLGRLDPAIPSDQPPATSTPEQERPRFAPPVQLADRRVALNPEPNWFDEIDPGEIDHELLDSPLPVEPPNKPLNEAQAEPTPKAQPRVKLSLVPALPIAKPTAVQRATMRRTAPTRTEPTKRADEIPRLTRRVIVQHRMQFEDKGCAVPINATECELVTEALKDLGKLSDREKLARCLEVGKLAAASSRAKGRGDPSLAFTFGGLEGHPQLFFRTRLAELREDEERTRRQTVDAQNAHTLFGTTEPVITAGRAQRVQPLRRAASKPTEGVTTVPRRRSNTNQRRVVLKASAGPRKGAAASLAELQKSMPPELLEFLAQKTQTSPASVGGAL